MGIRKGDKLILTIGDKQWAVVAVGDELNGKVAVAFGLAVMMVSVDDLKPMDDDHPLASPKAA